MSDYPTGWDEAKRKLEQLMRETRTDTIYVTIGLRMRNPTTKDVECSCTEEVEVTFEPQEYLCDAYVTKYDNRVHLDLLTGNDMF